MPREFSYEEAMGGVSTAAAPDAGGGLSFEEAMGIDTAAQGATETEKALNETSSLWKDLMKFAQTPSPAALQPAENLIRNVATWTPPGLEYGSPLYWAGRYNQEVGKRVGGIVGKAAETTGGAAVGISRATAAMATPMNVGLALLPGANVGVAGKAIQGAFTAQAVAHTPEMLEQIRQSYAKGDSAGVAEGIGGLVGSYLPALGLFKGFKEKGAPKPTKFPKDREVSQPGPAGFTTRVEGLSAEENAALVPWYEKLQRGEITIDQYSAEARKILSSRETSKPSAEPEAGGEPPAPTEPEPIIPYRGRNYRRNLTAGRWEEVDSEGNVLETFTPKTKQEHDVVDVLNQMRERPAPEVAIYEQGSKEGVLPETEGQAEVRASMLQKRYRSMGGDPEAVYRDMTDVAGEPPTWKEYADALEEEVTRYSGAASSVGITEWMAKKHGVTPAEYQKAIDIQERERSLAASEERENAALSKAEIAEEKRESKKGGRYARKEPSPTTLSEHEIRTLMGEKAPLRQPGQAAGAREQGPLVAKTPGAAEAGRELELRNRAVANVEKALNLPKNKAELVKLQEEELAPSDSEIKRLVDFEYKKLLKQHNAAQRQQDRAKARPEKVQKGEFKKKGYTAEPTEKHSIEPGQRQQQEPEVETSMSAATDLPKAGKGGTAEVIYKELHGKVVPVPGKGHGGFGISPFEKHATEGEGTRGAEIEAANRKLMEQIEAEERMPPQDTIAGQEEAKWRAKQKGEAAPQAEPTLVTGKKKTFKVRSSLDQFAFSPETPVATFIHDSGGMLSKSQAQASGKYKGNEANWDDTAKLSHPTHNKIYNKNGEKPDVLAQSLYDRGLIKEASVPEMNRALEKESASINKTREVAKKGEAEVAGKVKQAENFGTDQRKEREAGTKPIASSALSIGDTVDVEGHKLKVTDVDPDGNVTLEDGKRYGIQEISNDDLIYGELKEEAAARGEKPETPSTAAPAEPEKFSTKTDWQKISKGSDPARYENKHNKSIGITKNPEGKWDVTRSGEVVDTLGSREEAMRAYGHGETTPLGEHASKLRLKANKEGGYLRGDITMQDLADFGRRIYEKGMSYGKWAKDMVKHLGEKIKEHLKGIWENLTGGRTREGFKEMGAVGHTGFGHGKPVGKPKPGKAEKAAPARSGFGHGDPNNDPWVEANRRLDADPAYADQLVAELASGKRKTIDAADQSMLVQHKGMLQGSREKASKLMKDLQRSEGERQEAATLFENLDGQIRAIDLATRNGKLINESRPRSLWHTFSAKDYSPTAMEDKMIVARNGKPISAEQRSFLTNKSDKLSSLMAQIAALTRTSGWKPGVTKPPPGMRDMQFEAFKTKMALDNAVFKEKIKNYPKLVQYYLKGREALALPRALMASLDLSAVRRQGGLFFMGHPIRSLRAMPDMLRAARSERAYFDLMQDIRERANAELYKESGLGLTDIQNPKISELEEQYMSRWAEHIPAVSHSQRAYVYFLNRLRADTFDALAATVTHKGTPTLSQAKVISNFINVFTGRGSIPTRGAQAIAYMNEALFAPRYQLSRFQALLLQPLRYSIKTEGLSSPVTKMIAAEYARTLIGLGITYGVVATALKDQVEIETDPRSTDFGKIRIGDTRIDILSGLAQPTVFLVRSAPEVLGLGQIKSSSGEVHSLRATGSMTDETYSDVLQKFVRTKLAPIPAAYWNYKAGKKVTGEETQLLPKGEFLSDEFSSGELLSMVTPLTGKDILKAIKEQGIPSGTALGLLAFFGDSVNTYSPKVHVRERKPHRAR